jgi:hypothetical protein
MPARPAAGRLSRQPEPPPRRRGWIAWLALLNLLLQIVVPALHNPAQAQASAQSPLLICTAQGLVAVPADNSKPAQDRPASPAIPCPICLALHFTASFPPPATPALPALAMAETVVVGPALARATPGSRPFSAHRPRGPPTIA